MTDITKPDLSARAYRLTVERTMSAEGPNEESRKRHQEAWPVVLAQQDRQMTSRD